MKRVTIAGLLALGVAIAGCGGKDGGREATTVQEDGVPGGDGESVGSQAGGYRGKVEVVVIDGTIKRPPSKKLEVRAEGGGSFFPDIKHDTDAKRMVIGGHRLYVYPDGRKGKEIEVKIESPGDNVQDSAEGIEGIEEESITINISDSVVTIMGASVPGIEEKFRR